MKSSERTRNLPTMKVHQYEGFINGQAMSLHPSVSEGKWTLAICQC